MRAHDIEALATWDAKDEPSKEIAFTPARVLMQDFTGVPAVVDLAAMRDAMEEMGGDPSQIEPLVPAELVIDHSVQVDVYGAATRSSATPSSSSTRNRERYQFLRWGQQAFDIVQGRAARHGHRPPGQPRVPGARRVPRREERARLPGHARRHRLAHDDGQRPRRAGLGRRRHRGRGGDARPADVDAHPAGHRLQAERRAARGRDRDRPGPDGHPDAAREGRRRQVRRVLRPGPGEPAARRPRDDRQHVARVRVDVRDLPDRCGDAALPRVHRAARRADRARRGLCAASRASGTTRTPTDTTYTDTLELDLADVEPSLAGPKRPQDRVPLRSAKPMFRTALAGFLPDPVPHADSQEPGHDEGVAESFPASDPPAGTQPGHGGDFDDAPAPVTETVPAGGIALAERSPQCVKVTLESGEEIELDHGHVVIAAITSCTNTSNPSVMLAAGLLARNAVARGMKRKAWVKTSLAPGSKVVMDYYERAGLVGDLEALGFHLVGYGCTTCIGNSGPLPDEVSAAVQENDLAVCSVLSGNRNFEGRINADVKMNYLASPPLVVAYALAGTMDIDLVNDPLGVDDEGALVYLRDIWPSTAEIARLVESAVQSDMFRETYAEVFTGDERWAGLDVPDGDRFEWDEDSTYVRRPTFFQNLADEPEAVSDIAGARVLALLGDSVTTDHISPAGSIRRDGPAGAYLQEHGVEPRDFNSYGSRRGNHEVMVRGTFANIRLRNLLVPGSEGGVTIGPDGETTTIYDAAVAHAEQGTPLVVIAGKEYGSGSSRDWAAKGTRLLGVRAVMAESYERIHRSNLVGMGVLPLQFMDGESAESLGLTGQETYEVTGLEGADPLPREVSVKADGKEIRMRVRIDTPKEEIYFRHGGILQFVLRQLASS